MHSRPAWQGALPPSSNTCFRSRLRHAMIFCGIGTANVGREKVVADGIKSGREHSSFAAGGETAARGGRAGRNECEREVRFVWADRTRRGRTWTCRIPLWTACHTDLSIGV